MDALRRAIDRYVDGRIGLDELLGAVQGILASDPAARSEWPAVLERVRRSGALGADVLGALARIPLGAEVTVVRGAGDGTLMREPPRPAADGDAAATADATRMRAPAAPAAPDSDATQLRAAPPPPPAATLLRPAPAGHGERDVAAARPPDPAPQERVSHRPAPRRAPLAALDVGAELRGRYVLEELIGQGAMGQVWRARDRLSEEAQDRNPYVAVKVLTSELEEHPEGFIAMHREASRAQKLAHPNIVTVHVFDRDESSGRAFIAMELLQGRPLDRVVREAPVGGLRREDALPLIRGMAEGLAYAHRRGLVHCDFKPGNVFVTAEGTPKILDFGIARAARVAEKGPAAVFAAAEDSSFQGYTPGYAAPELIAGREPHPADDVFSLGVVAYELLGGRHPFDRRSADEARAARLRPAPLKGVSRREWRAIETALALEREARWPDAAAFLGALAGTRQVWKALAAAVVVLAIASGVLWYRSHLEAQPAVPFEQLAPELQSEIRDALGRGFEALAYLERTRDVRASADAAEYFAAAYALHPRNHEAVRGLEDAADEAIAWYSKLEDRQLALEQLKSFQAKSPFYAKYRPMVRAIRRLEGG